MVRVQIGENGLAFSVAFIPALVPGLIYLSHQFNHIAMLFNPVFSASQRLIFLVCCTTCVRLDAKRMRLLVSRLEQRRRF